MATFVLVPFVGSAGAAQAIPLNANPQDHCNDSVCVGAESVNGSGPDIIAAQVETRGQFYVPIHTVIYLNYGPTAAASKTRGPLGYCIVETTILYGCNFLVNRVLNVGWELCGQMTTIAGYPCIKIG